MELLRQLLRRLWSGVWRAEGLLLRWRWSLCLMLADWNERGLLWSLLLLLHVVGNEIGLGMVLDVML